MRVIPASYRILALVLLLIAGIGFGYVQGISRESDRRNAQALAQERAASQAFRRALDNGKQHATNVIRWQQKARTYYRNWKEALKHETDSTLAQCQTTDGTGSPQDGVHVVMLSPTWVGLYNAAWTPDFTLRGDTGRVAYSLVETGTPSLGLRSGVTPREALDNVRINAELCGEDRKRLDELIDHVRDTLLARPNETGVAP